MTSDLMPGWVEFTVNGDSSDVTARSVVRVRAEDISVIQSVPVGGVVAGQQQCVICMRGGAWINVDGTIESVTKAIDDAVGGDQKSVTGELSEENEVFAAGDLVRLTQGNFPYMVMEVIERRPAGYLCRWAGINWLLRSDQLAHVTEETAEAEDAR